MAEITAALVKQLRERTGAGIVECKKALEATEGDIEKAIDYLRKKGIASAAKKASRTTRQGSITVELSLDRASGAILEFNCESDFVARTDDFQTLVGELTRQALEAPAGTTRDQLLEHPFRGDPTHTVAQTIAGKIGTIGENMQLARFKRVDGGFLGGYIHPGAQLGALVQMSGVSAETAQKPELQELIRDIAMQVAAADPQFVRREEVPAAVLEREKEVQRDRARGEGRPDKVVEKMIEGRLSKFFEEFCLLEQPFIKDNGFSVAQLVAEKGKKLGAGLNVARFIRYKVGETSPAEAAAEA